VGPRTGIGGASPRRRQKRKKLELASRLGLNVSELINDVLAEKLDAYLTQKSKQRQSELNAITA
jgi:hypothetical protein